MMVVCPSCEREVSSVDLCAGVCPFCWATARRRCAHKAVDGPSDEDVRQMVGILRTIAGMTRPSMPSISRMLADAADLLEALNHDRSTHHSPS